MEILGTEEVTRLLKAWGAGDHEALTRLTQMLHGELHGMARRHMRKEHVDNSLQATALVNEVYLKLVDIKTTDWQHRAHFFAISAQIMRNILVDAARSRSSEKRGGGLVKTDFDSTPLLAATPDKFILALHDSLNAFSDLAPRQARVVELRYFGGMSEEETAEVMKTSVRTVRRDWKFAKAWLQRELGGTDPVEAQQDFPDAGTEDS